jgi:hypothetical protein
VTETTIAGFRQDDVGDWIADLACGHSQHMRHKPPMTFRPWVLTEEGRNARVGAAIECVQCERASTSSGSGSGSGSSSSKA